MSKKKSDNYRLYSYWSKAMPFITPRTDYKKEAGIYSEILLKHNPKTKTLLELGCGAGNNAYYLKKRFKMTLTDASNNMIALSKKLNRSCEHVVGDMRTIRLKKQFDAVFIHDSLSYMTTRKDLFRAIKTAYFHCVPGGCALFVPDFFKETFRARTSHGGSDRGNSGARYLEWVYDPHPSDNVYFSEFAVLFKSKSGRVSSLYERHKLGIFSRQEWLNLLGAVGFEGRFICAPYNQEGIENIEMILAAKK